MKAYAFKTTDLGKTWTNIIPNDDVTGFARNIQEDYVNKDLLFLGTELGLYITLMVEINGQSLQKMYLLLHTLY